MGLCRDTLPSNGAKMSHKSFVFIILILASAFFVDSVGTRRGKSPANLPSAMNINAEFTLKKGDRVVVLRSETPRPLTISAKVAVGRATLRLTSHDENGRQEKRSAESDADGWIPIHGFLVSEVSFEASDDSNLKFSIVENTRN